MHVYNVYTYVYVSGVLKSIRSEKGQGFVRNFLRIVIFGPMLIIALAHAEAAKVVAVGLQLACS